MNRTILDCFMLMGTALSLKGHPEMGRPILQETLTTRVYLSLNIEKVQLFEGMDKIQMYLDVIINQKWIDKRLGSDSETQKKAIAGQIWKPKIFPLNAKINNCNKEDTVFWRGYSNDGSVILSEKLELELLCRSNYNRFPFDEPSCKIQFGSCT